MYKLFLCLRYLRKRRIAFFAVGAVCLCVAMVLIVFSVMDGFLRMVRERSRGMLGDLVMENGALQGFPFYQEFIDEIKNDPQLKACIHQATPVIITYGVLRYPDPRYQITKPAQIVGIRLHEIYDVNDFKRGLFYEKYYPGSTSLAPQKAPGYGPDSQGDAVLPPDLEAAWKKWWDSASPQERAKAPIEGDLPYNGVGYYRPVPFEEHLNQPTPGPAWFGPELSGAIIGTDMCARRTADGSYQRFHWRGEEVELTMVPMSESGRLADAAGAPRKAFRYVDDCRTGVYDIDSMSVYVDFNLLQHILIMDNWEAEVDQPDGSKRKEIQLARATQVQIKLTPDAPVLATRDAIQEKWRAFIGPRLDKVKNRSLLEEVRVLTWEEKQANFIAAVEKEKILVTVLFGIISLVAVLLVGCIFYMIVQQKTRDIGIVKSVGATSLGVAGIFIAYGAAVGVVGGAIGTLVGAFFVHYINEIQDLMAKISPSAVIWSPEVYVFDRIPNQVSPIHAVVIYAVAILASMAGSLIAARRAAKVWPVEALRYE
jgi:lipoprotein-releasing system permease protein